MCIVLNWSMQAAIISVTVFMYFVLYKHVLYVYIISFLSSTASKLSIPSTSWNLCQFSVVV